MTNLPKPVLKLGKLNIDRISKNFLALTVIVVATEVALLLNFRGQLPPAVPLFYSLPWGNIRLADPTWLWLLPALSVAGLGINLVGAHLSNDLTLTRILSGTAWLVSLLALITLSKIIILGLP